MAEVRFVKSVGGSLLPAHDIDVESLQSIKTGAYVLADIKQPRNPDFHRKFFALLNLGFEYFEPEMPEYQGKVAEKNFEKFRGDVIVLAGYYDVVVALNGKVQLKPKSISFAKMDEIEFNNLYRAVFNVIWKKVMIHVQGFTEEQMELAVNQLLSFN